ncbi:MAG: TauD/TfdA family dioxygenase [Aliidongia sp.]
MIEVTPSGQILGARITGLDLAQPLDDRALGTVLRALADHGVVCFPDQRLDAAAQVAFSRNFGALEIHVSGAFQTLPIPRS